MVADEFRTPRSLLGRHVELVPLERSQRDALWAAAQDPEVGRFLRTPPGPGREQLDRLVERSLRGLAYGTDLPFAVRVAKGPYIGMTNFLRIDRANRAVEIGGTWLDSRCWRTPVNTEAKYLLLRHAFEEERYYRVQLQTDLRNVRSQRAIERIGGVREAVLREDALVPGPYWRSSVMYSLLAPEWPAAKARLEEKLARPWTAGPEGTR
jgi:RimJ/RimL family protein N-acetyltransferase